ncbi:MAG: hypothetical protein JO027_16230 [Solirubrobacterales bacterium]|nr:hypothetical protein [Solirubrobacterales bacterium]
MSEGPTAAGAAHRLGSGTTRLVRAWRALPHESRLAAFASGALFVTLFLPWYQVTLIARAKTSALQSASATITGWGAFSFVEAAVLLVAAGVITLLFQRAEGRAFHLPGGDGGVITAAGVWTCVLIVWRIFDKQGATTNGPSATTSGIEWGIFFALAAAAFLAYSGSRIRAAHRPEPPLPGTNEPPAGSSAAATTVRMRRAAPAGPERLRPSAARAPAARAPAAPAPARPERPRPPEAPPADPAPGRPRRRATAAELFERVVPDDPPTMPFGRAKRSDADITIRRSVPKPPADEQLTIPFAGREDDTAVLGEDATLRLGDDDTRRLDR